MRSLILCIVLLSPSVLSEPITKLIVWNVGQGQFVTFVHNNTCHHFDMGGEYFNSHKDLLNSCYSKRNEINITHWDKDHISFIRNLSPLLPRFCIRNYPQYGKNKVKQLKLKHCAHSGLHTIEALNPNIFWPNQVHAKNDKSIIYIVFNQILIPGDSTRKLEKLWASLLPQENEIKVLVAGHHGSHTSTSTLLLKALKNLKMVITSSRKHKYGHPHFKTKKSLKTILNLRLFTTENYGDIKITF